MIRDFDNGVLKLMGKCISVRWIHPYDSTIARKQTSIRNHIQANEKKIDDLNYEIEQKETDLFEHFAVMESAVASIKQQGNFLSGLS